jgi:hypothetical protein
MNLADDRCSLPILIALEGDMRCNMLFEASLNLEILLIYAPAGD